MRIVSIFWGATLIVVLLVAGCAGDERKPIPTGVVVNELKDGGTEFLSTGRASEKALAENSFPMKQTTSCKAAKEMLERELSGRGERPNYSKAEFFLIYDAEYCRVRYVVR